MSERRPVRNRVRVLVCGERQRGDDAAALLAADMLPADSGLIADVIATGQLSVEALLDVPEGVAVIVADAAVGVAAGRVVTLPLSEIAAGLGAAGATPASSHSLAPDQVIALADEMRGTPLRGVFVGIGAVDFGFGDRLSPEVEAGLPAFAAALAVEIRRLAAG